jgi:pimeloyl-ACP methyl ester carboxylesterase
VRANGVTLDVAQAGPEGGPLVLLLHGFPETSYGWRRQIPALAAAGFRVWAPDGRGYGRSDRPRGVDAYRIDRLAGDVVALMEAAGRDRARLVGHDWGAAVAWWLAAAEPARVERLAILNVPHFRVMKRFLWTSPSQWLRSSYMLFFQLSGLAEWLLSRRDFRALERALVRSSRPGTFDAEALDVYRQAWRAPGALTAMLSWYRAAARRGVPDPPCARVAPPTLILWGARDAFLSRRMARASLAWCDQGRLEVKEEATHWVHLEEAAWVNERLCAFLGGGGAPVP